jgi:isopropylmalate/homocitrate/citramalate synthase
MRPALPSRVTVVEVGPRDGLQNQPRVLPVGVRAAFVDRLASSGLPVVEIGAFVSPKWVPQMADTADVIRAIRPCPETRLTALVPNLTGLARAADAGVTEVAVLAAASETFSQRNTNQSIAESIEACTAVCTRAGALGLRVRGYLSTCFACPYEGPVPPRRVASLVRALLDAGVYEVAVSDTIGAAGPGDIWTVLGEVSTAAPLSAIALHLHDTRGMALANVLAGLQAGIATFDASCGGLGGCPYAPGASGNLATDDLVCFLDGLGIGTGVALEGVLAASAFIAAHVDQPLPSRVYQARAAQRARASTPDGT